MRHTKITTVLEPKFAEHIKKIAANQEVSTSAFIERILRDFTEGKLIRRNTPALNLFEFSCKASINLASLEAYYPQADQTILLMANGSQIVLNQSWEQTKQDLITAGALVR